MHTRSCRVVEDGSADQGAVVVNALHLSVINKIRDIIQVRVFRFVFMAAVFLCFSSVVIVDCYERDRDACPESEEERKNRNDDANDERVHFSMKAFHAVE